MTEPKNGRPIFFPEKLVVYGNLTLFLWIVLDTAAFLLFDITYGIVFFVLTLILIYGVLNFLGCLRPCYNCIKCTHGMGRLAALYFGRRIFKDYKYNYKLPTAIFFTLIHRSVSSSIRTLLCPHRLHSLQSSNMCGTHSAYDL